MKTCLRFLKDGAVEVIRLLAPDDLDRYEKDDPLLYEKSIVWLEDCEELPYVRVKTVRTARSRRGPIHVGEGGRVVGYAKLTPNAPRCGESHGYVRRLFYLTAEDLAGVDTHIPPSAVDPKTVLPGMQGKPVSAAHDSQAPRPFSVKDARLELRSSCGGSCH